MNLRTIRFWVVYNPKLSCVISIHRLKPKPMTGCVVVKMKGHYVRPADRGREDEQR